MRSSLVVRASDCQCTSCNGPGFDPSIRRHSGIWGAADEAVLNIVWKLEKIPPPPKKKGINNFCRSYFFVRWDYFTAQWLKCEKMPFHHWWAVFSDPCGILIRIWIRTRILGSGDWFTDPDLDRALFGSGFQDANKNKLTSVFRDNMSLRIF